jgi:hypothetical protein
VSRPLSGSDLDGQRVLVPLQVRDVLPADHRVWQVLDQVAEFDLAPFLAAYRIDGVGRPPYHPRLLLALIIYCYGNGSVLCGRSARPVGMTWAPERSWVVVFRVFGR